MEKTLKYRVETDLFFENEADALVVLNAVEKVKGKVWNPTGGIIEMDRRCRVHKCYHDENPPLQCKDYTRVDFASVLEVHTEIK